ncbi:hypothetical protein HN51_056509 [Arachis hypogaea]|uniref:Uncharacterized protein n=1 Tax=Arachis hypogaea TaxID=3818 RepID=A0A445BDZ7_ARAHY|nr:uncharacterized protein LOC107616832 [Arachis ipaensis]XP_025620929.1 uncharacterized protein LOC112712298 [Arachis hypogaea]XP_057736293.1 uncharacterized protein LOC130951613 [Arachis stenosperma]RYQ93323.1 hypothetical protein Ahy_B09g099595 [Arachis hypogaea]RYR36876.1 hypothetical protein Ahy_A09g041831 [Arachis hypogaea]
MELRNVVKDKKFWLASLIIVWAAGLQGHMMWLQRQESFKHKFGDLNSQDHSDPPTS